jgi:small-conductance mechanosensitive channel
LTLSVALALVASAGGLALLLAALQAARRRSFLVRQITFPLGVGAAALTLEIYALLQPGDRRLPEVLSWTLLFLALVTVLRLLGLFLFDVHLHGREGLRLPPLLPAVAMGLVYLVTALVTLKLSFPAFDVGPLLATSAVTSLVLGLALQPILANFFAGLVLSVERPFRINDWIRVGDQEGRVVAINWRTTHLRTRDNDNVVIPNARLADERVLNFYYPHPMHMERVRVALPAKAPPYRVRRLLGDCAAGVAGTLDKPTPEVFLLSFDESAITYELRVWIEDVAQAPRIASDLRTRIWEELRRHDIELPIPARALEVVPRRRAGGAKAGGAKAGEAKSGGAKAALPPPARLYVLDGPERGRTLDLDGDGGPRTIGRSRACSLPLTDPNASKEHLRIEWDGGAWTMTDLGSSFGTRVNGQAASRVALRRLDRITVGDTVMIFESDEF